ncbi:MAG TPA: C4-dicarboxylate ABC transporter permease, partial [Geodermatophilus sp.]|nr:C4-dicarboxylate ABC transporter permease [Geodermatophilus sp.]
MKMKLPGRTRSHTTEDEQAQAEHSRHDSVHKAAHHAAHRQGGIVDVATLDKRPGADPVDDPDRIDEEALIAEFEAEKPARQLTGWPSWVTAVVGVGLSLFGLYWVFNPMPRQVYLPTFLSIGLFLTFLTYRGWPRSAKAK